MFLQSPTIKVEEVEMENKIYAESVKEEEIRY